LLLNPDADPKAMLEKLNLGRKYGNFMKKARRLGIAESLNFPDARNPKKSRESVKKLVDAFKAIHHEDKREENRLKNAFIKRHAVKKATFMSWVDKDFDTCCFGFELVERKNSYE